MQLTPFFVIWAALALVTVGLAVARKLTTAHEDDTVHLAAGSQAIIPQQLAFAAKVERMDRLGKALTVATLAFGVVLGGIYLYQLAIQHSQLAG